VAYRTFFTGKACLTLLVFIGLSGCSIPTIFDHQITWNTPYLNQTECPDLDGTYQNRGKLYGLLIHLVRNIQRSDEEGTYRSIKYAPTPPEEYMRTYKEKSMSSNVFANSSLSDKEYERKKTIFLREQSVITIKRPAPFVIEATLGDKMGRQYQKSIYSFENQSSQFKVGCCNAWLLNTELFNTAPPPPRLTLRLCALYWSWFWMSEVVSEAVTRLFLPSAAALSVLAITAPFRSVLPLTLTLFAAVNRGLLPITR